MKSPLFSYLRHWLTLQATKLATNFNLPTEGLDNAVNYLVEAVLLLGFWLVVKYGAPLLKRIGFEDSGAAKLPVLLGGVLLCVGLAAPLTSCSAAGGASGTLYFIDEESGAKGGLAFKPGAKPAPFFRLPGIGRLDFRPPPDETDEGSVSEPERLGGSPPIVRVEK